MRRRADGEAAAHGAERRFAGVVEAFAADPRTAKLAREYATREPTAGARFGSNGLEVKGRLFAMLVRGALVVKLPKRRVDALVAEGAGERFDPRHGRVMKEWLVVRGDTRWLELAREAHDFVAGGPGAALENRRLPVARGAPARNR